MQEDFTDKEWQSDFFAPFDQPKIERVDNNCKKSNKEWAFSTAYLICQLDQFLRENSELRAFPPGVDFITRWHMSSSDQVGPFLNARKHEVAPLASNEVPVVASEKLTTALEETKSNRKNVFES